MVGGEDSFEGQVSSSADINAVIEDHSGVSFSFRSVLGSVSSPNLNLESAT